MRAIVAFPEIEESQRRASLAMVLSTAWFSRDSAICSMLSPSSFIAPSHSACNTAELAFLPALHSKPRAVPPSSNLPDPVRSGSSPAPSEPAIAPGHLPSPPTSSSPRFVSCRPCSSHVLSLAPLLAEVDNPQPPALLALTSSLSNSGVPTTSLHFKALVLRTTLRNRDFV